MRNILLNAHISVWTPYSSVLVCTFGSPWWARDHRLPQKVHRHRSQSAARSTWHWSERHGTSWRPIHCDRGLVRSPLPMFSKSMFACLTRCFQSHLNSRVKQFWNAKIATFFVQYILQKWKNYHFRAVGFNNRRRVLSCEHIWQIGAGSERTNCCKVRSARILFTPADHADLATLTLVHLFTQLWQALFEALNHLDIYRHSNKKKKLFSISRRKIFVIMNFYRNYYLRIQAKWHILYL